MRPEARQLTMSLRISLHHPCRAPRAAAGALLHSPSATGERSSSVEPPDRSLAHHMYHFRGYIGYSTVRSPCASHTPPFPHSLPLCAFPPPSLASFLSRIPLIFALLSSPYSRSQAFTVQYNRRCIQSFMRSFQSHTAPRSSAAHLCLNGAHLERRRSGDRCRQFDDHPIVSIRWSDESILTGVGLGSDIQCCAYSCTILVRCSAPTAVRTVTPFLRVGRPLTISLLKAVVQTREKGERLRS